ncbi:MAG: DUF2085 domain-containing protein [Anaerolineales bacterium]|nr:DUF2085 domain-containing protein [Anaerolineales bacterium]
MLTVTLYTRDGCTLCQEAEKDLKNLEKEYPHRLVLIDIEKDNIPEFVDQIPVIEVGPYQIKPPFDIKTIKMTLSAAQDRMDQLDKINLESHQKRVERGKKISFGDKLFHWLSYRYMFVFNAFVFLYVGLAVLAPVLQANGFSGPAKVIYVVYSKLCHQLAYRSWFILGEQNAYPREIAKIESLMGFEEATGINPYDIDAATHFIGNDILGYKLALCERDIAIYGAILLFGLIFSLTGRRIPSLSIAAWFILGIIPIGLDGVSQILSQLPWDIIPVRESTPLLRTITGGLFGFATAWFGYPIVEETMADTRKIMTVKIRASQPESKK